MILEDLNDMKKSPKQDAQEQALLLEEDTVIYLCQSKVLHSLSTFLQTYTKPTNILMDSGQLFVCMCVFYLGLDTHYSTI
ncbi:unnamed protein product [Coregonus sp. 'balchen']|nr:unnamed protein product [Coregonus sp. 'balchen']